MGSPELLIASWCCEDCLCQAGQSHLLAQCPLLSWGGGMCGSLSAGQRVCMVGCAWPDLGQVGVQGKGELWRVCRSGCIHASKQGSSCTGVHARQCKHAQTQRPCVGFEGPGQLRSSARSSAAPPADAGVSPRDENGAGLGHSCGLGVASARPRLAGKAGSEAERSQASARAGWK